MLTIRAHLAGCDRIPVILQFQLAFSLLAILLLAHLLLEELPHVPLLHPLSDAGVCVCLALKPLEGGRPEPLVVHVDRAVLLQSVRVAQSVLPPLLHAKVGKRKVVGGLLALARGHLLDALEVLQHLVLEESRLRVPHLLLDFRIVHLALLEQLGIQHGMVHPELSLARVQQLRAALHFLLAFFHDLLRQLAVMVEMREVRVGRVRSLEAGPCRARQRHKALRSIVGCEA
mmetsp:Transcript_76329/g.210695  ORF Transcript_76329/g.210695 Transcript_76329/m.210695 type:complete len:230 (-) Transcript_76329:95-784(-)